MLSEGVSVKIKQLEAFRAVMLAGSMVRAAEILRVSQPAISQAIQRLEILAGVAFFERRNGRLFPTPEANILFSESERVYSGLRKLDKFVEDLRFSRHGSLRVAGFPAVTRRFLPMVLAQYCQSKPELHVVLESAQSHEIGDLIARREIDMALSIFPADREEVQSVQVGTLEAVCVLPADHTLTAKSVIVPEDLEGERFISIGNGDHYRMQIDKVFEAARIQRSMVMETNQSEVACSMTAEKMGISIVDQLTASYQNEIQVITLPFRPIISIDIWLNKLRTSNESLLIRDFSLFLQKKSAEYISYQQHPNLISK